MSKQSLAGSAGKIKSEKIEKFLEEVASKSPTPGGGAVAAVAGAFAAALVEMVANLTKDGSLTSVAKKAKLLRLKLLKLADADVAAFQAVMKNWKTSRREASLKKATEVPLQTALLSQKVLGLTQVALKKGNQNAASDAKSAIYLAKAAIAAAAENVKINLKLIKDKKFIKKINLHEF